MRRVGEGVVRVVIVVTVAVVLVAAAHSAVRTTSALAGPVANPIDDLRRMLALHFMVNAYRAGTVVAVIAGAIGWFMVLRRQSFAGHTLAVVSFPGAAGAVWLLPAATETLRVLALIAAGVVAIRAVWALCDRASTLSLQERDRRMDRLGAGLQDASRLIGPAAVVFALVLPWLPFADRSVIDLGVVLLTLPGSSLLDAKNLDEPKTQ